MNHVQWKWYVHFFLNIYLSFWFSSSSSPNYLLISFNEFICFCKRQMTQIQWKPNVTFRVYVIFSIEHFNVIRNRIYVVFQIGLGLRVKVTSFMPAIPPAILTQFSYHACDMNILIKFIELVWFLQLRFRAKCIRQPNSWKS